jgi:hypothetical protein
MLNHPKMGEGYTPAYQMSSTPFVTSSTLTLGQTKQIDFPCVSRFITVQNTGGSTLALSFTENGLKPANSNYYVLSGSTGVSCELRTQCVFLSGSGGSTTFSLIAGLTLIPTSSLTPITGSYFYGVG